MRPSYVYVGALRAQWCAISCNVDVFSICPHSVFMCFVWIWEQTAIISLYSINWLVFVTETECVYCAVQTEFWQRSARFVMYASLTSSGQYMYHQVNIHSVFMCFLWIWEQAAVISLYNINWLVFVMKAVWVYCGAGTKLLNILSMKFGLQRYSWHAHKITGGAIYVKW
jgi:hypothetical protein